MSKNYKYEFKDPFTSRSELDKYCKNYVNNMDFKRKKKEDDVELLGKICRKNVIITYEQFMTFSDWKSPRMRRKTELNNKKEVEKITSLALNQKDIRLALWLLISLQGVGFPFASVLLHFSHKRRFPILDVRALASVGFVDGINYTLEFWEEYVWWTRDLSKKYGVDMRHLDRALWQFDNEGMNRRR